VPEENEGEECCGDCGVECDGMERRAVGWDAKAPGELCGEASVAAFGKVSEGEESPGEGGTGGPGVERIKEGEMFNAEVDRGGDEGEEDAHGAERGHHQQKDWEGNEVVQIGDDEKEAGECEGGEEGEEAGVPEFFGVEA
jgi:hypothetical protein